MKLIEEFKETLIKKNIEYFDPELLEVLEKLLNDKVQKIENDLSKCAYPYKVGANMALEKLGIKI